MSERFDVYFLKSTPSELAIAQAAGRAFQVPPERVHVGPELSPFGAAVQVLVSASPRPYAKTLDLRVADAVRDGRDAAQVAMTFADALRAPLVRALGGVGRDRPLSIVPGKDPAPIKGDGPWRPLLAERRLSRLRSELRDAPLPKLQLEHQALFDRLQHKLTKEGLACDRAELAVDVAAAERAWPEGQRPLAVGLLLEGAEALL